MLSAHVTLLSTNLYRVTTPSDPNSLVAFESANHLPPWSRPWVPKTEGGQVTSKVMCQLIVTDPISNRPKEDVRDKQSQTYKNHYNTDRTDRSPKTDYL